MIADRGLLMSHQEQAITDVRLVSKSGKKTPAFGFITKQAINLKNGSPGRIIFFNFLAP